MKLKWAGLDRSEPDDYELFSWNGNSLVLTENTEYQIMENGNHDFKVMDLLRLGLAVIALVQKKRPFRPIIFSGIAIPIQIHRRKFPCSSTFI